MWWCDDVISDSCLENVWWLFSDKKTPKWYCLRFFWEFSNTTQASQSPAKPQTVWFLKKRQLKCSDLGHVKRSSFLNLTCMCVVHPSQSLLQNIIHTHTIDIWFTVCVIYDVLHVYRYTAVNWRAKINLPKPICKKTFFCIIFSQVSHPAAGDEAMTSTAAISWQDRWGLPYLSQTRSI